MNTATIDDQLCPWTWPHPVGHRHACSRVDNHRGDHECMCGAITTREDTDR